LFLINILILVEFIISNIYKTLLLYINNKKE